MTQEIDQATTRIQLAAIVVSKLAEKGFSTILVGGSVVSIYTDNEYESKDLDFISPANHQEIALAMKELGFSQKGKDFYHSNCHFTVEFPSGPAGIGDMEPVKPEGEIEVDGVIIKLFSPTQCVMDRLAWFYFSNDRQGLEQALLVCKRQEVNLDKVRRWSKAEGELEKFEVFLTHLGE